VSHSFALLARENDFSRSVCKADHSQVRAAVVILTLGPTGRIVIQWQPGSAFHHL